MQIKQAFEDMGKNEGVQLGMSFNIKTQTLKGTIRRNCGGLRDTVLSGR